MAVSLVKQISSPGTSRQAGAYGFSCIGKYNFHASNFTGLWKGVVRGVA